ncbi:MAG: T9SS type A sorting domain-containing protein, partial [Bacteroidales bacterium]|nr:T9SS type A sorting domain-containing protein [Bacteroidales bacterium]
MKKSTILFMGILLGTIFVSRHLISRSAMLPDEDPPGVEKAVSEVKVFPNPSDGRFQLTFEYNGKEKVHAKVYDITGKMVNNISEDLVTGETSV